MVCSYLKVNKIIFTEHSYCTRVSNTNYKILHGPNTHKLSITQRIAPCLRNRTQVGLDDERTFLSPKGCIAIDSENICSKHISTVYSKQSHCEIIFRMTEVYIASAVAIR